MLWKEMKSPDRERVQEKYYYQRRTGLGMEKETSRTAVFDSLEETTMWSMKASYICVRCPHNKKMQFVEYPSNRFGQQDSRTTGQPDSRTAGQPDSRTAGQPDSRTTGQPDSRTRQPGVQKSLGSPKCAGSALVGRDAQGGGTAGSPARTATGLLEGIGTGLMGT